MTTQNDDNFVDVNTDDLDSFNDLLHGQATEQPAPEATEDEPEVEDNVDTDNEDDVSPEDDADLATEDDDSDDADPEADEEDEPKGKPKSRFQERINELTQKARGAEREAERLKTLLDDAIARLDAKAQDKEKEPAKPVLTAEDGPPNPDEKNEDGSDKYPLGEFDPAYLRDYSRFVVRKEHEAIQQEEAQKAESEAAAKAQQELVGQWNTKLTEASETKYPDMLDKTNLIEDTFRDIPEDYGNYLAATIMSMDYGPDVLYHLANNIDEAKSIVASGPAMATVALGRLEARFALLDEENTTEKKLKVSKAPTPPARLNKGTSVTQEVPDDTDDLDAFTAKLYKQKR